MAWIKNIEHEKCLAVTDEVSYQPGQIVSKTLAQTRHHSLTLLARLNNVNPIDSPITMKEPAWN